MGEIAEGGRTRMKQHRHQPVSEDSKQNRIKDLLFLVFPGVGILLIVSKFWLPLETSIFRIFGFFLILYWSIVFAQVNRARLHDFQNGYFALLSIGEEIKLDKKRVILYTFFCLLPLYMMLTIPSILAIIIGEIAAWVFLGVPFLFISAFAMWGFSSVWKDLHLNPIFFWMMQLLIFATFNGLVFLFCFI